MLKHLFPLLALLFASILPAQERIRLTHSCSYDGEENATEYYSFAPSTEADGIVQEICDAMGLDKNFVIKSANVRNAVATMADGKRVILYSTLFLEKFKVDTRTKWAAYSVMAHEIGHHLNGHNFNEPDAGKRKSMELQADKFSGSALRLLNAPLDDAKAGTEIFALEGETKTHPAGSARREAVASGWKLQDERLKALGVVTPTRNPVTATDHDGDGVSDTSDKCPDEYGPSATGGCPDGDGDGIPDGDDACKYQKGPAKWQGCPDSDGDGLPDHQDQCPNSPGLPANKGCPPADRDADGVPDTADKCPDLAGARNWQGCPDSDDDGIPDHDDKCPTEKGTFALGGCAEKTVAPAPELMKLIQGGAFDMGDVMGDNEYDNEKPVHSVTLSSFYLGKTEVTLREFKAFIDATGYKTDAEKGGDSYIYDGSSWVTKSGVNWRHDEQGNVRTADNHPVIHVSWNDAVAYCNWLSEKQNLTKVYTISGDNVTASWNATGYRLPTEAEWEYAARQRGQKVRFGNGKDIADPSEINFDGRADYKKPYSVSGLYRGKTTPVGSFTANSLGLHDMSGNVWEWCWDWYGDYASGTQTNPRGASSGSYRVLRGGSWYYLPVYTRAARRGSNTPSDRYANFGFRLARAAGGG